MSPQPQSKSEASASALSRSWSTVRMQGQKLPSETQLASQISSTFSTPPYVARLLTHLALSNPSADYLPNLSHSFANLHAWPSVIARAVFPSHRLTSLPESDLFDESVLALSGLTASLHNQTPTSAATPLQQLSFGLHVTTSPEGDHYIYAPLPRETQYSLVSGLKPELQFEAELDPPRRKSSSHQPSNNSNRPQPNRSLAERRRLKTRPVRDTDPFATYALGRNSSKASPPSLSRRPSAIRQTTARPHSKPNVRNLESTVSSPVVQNQNGNAAPSHVESRVPQPSNSVQINLNQEDDDDDVIDLGVSLGPEDDVVADNAPLHLINSAEQRNVRNSNGTRNAARLALARDLEMENARQEEAENGIEEVGQRGNADRNAAEEDEYERDENGEIMYGPSGAPVRRLGSKAGQLGGIDAWREKVIEFRERESQKLEERRKEVTPLVAPSDTGFARLQERKLRMQKKKETVQARKEKEKARAELERKRKKAKSKKRATTLKGQGYSDSDILDDESEEDERDPRSDAVEVIDDPSDTSPVGKKQRLDSAKVGQYEQFGQGTNSGAGMQGEYGQSRVREGGQNQFYHNGYNSRDQYNLGGGPSNWQTAAGPPSRGAQPAVMAGAGPSTGPGSFNNSYGQPPYHNAGYGPNPPYPPYPPPHVNNRYPPAPSPYGYDSRYDAYHQAYRSGNAAPPYHQGNPRDMGASYGQQNFNGRPRLSQQEFMRKRNELQAAIRSCSQDLNERDAKEIDAFLDNQLFMFAPTEDSKDYILKQTGNTVLILRIKKREGTWAVVRMRPSSLGR